MPNPGEGVLDSYEHFSLLLSQTAGTLDFLRVFSCIFHLFEEREAGL